MTTTFRPEVASTIDQARLPEVLTAHIGGGFTTPGGGPRIEVDDPATGEVVASFEVSSPEIVDEAVRNAAEAFARWAAVSPAERGRLLSGVATAIRRDADLLARLESIDSGKPVSQARTDIAGSARYFEYYAGLADKIHGETLPQPNGTF